jgi:hypothetical protein
VKEGNLLSCHFTSPIRAAHSIRITSATVLSPRRRKGCVDTLWAAPPATRES